MSSTLRIQKVTELPETVLAQFNQLLDEGTVWDQEQGQHFLSNPDTALFIADWDGEPVGFLTAHRLPRFDRRRAEVLIYEVGVAEAHQRQGIGTALLQAVKDWAAQVGADEIWVLTNRSNSAAMALYRSSGGVQESQDEQMFVFKV